MIELTGCDFIVGDSAQILTELPESIIDLTVTSPSYDGLRDYKGYVFDFEAIATELYRVIKPGGVVVWVVADATVDASETGTSFRQALYFKACGFNLHDTMLYKKKGTGACGSNNAYWQTFEFMFIFSKGNPKTFNPIQDIQNARVGTQSGKRRYPNGSARPGLGNPSPRMSRRTNIWEYATGNATSDDAATHPAVFPESLAADHIKSWSNVGDLVLDPFSGSGTTGKMAYKFGRRFLGIEISPDYVALAQQRLAKEQNQPALFASSEIG